MVFKIFIHFIFSYFSILKKKHFAVWILINTNSSTKCFFVFKKIKKIKPFCLKSTFPVGMEDFQVSDKALIGLLGIWTPVSGSLMHMMHMHETHEIIISYVCVVWKCKLYSIIISLHIDWSQDIKCPLF